MIGEKRRRGSDDNDPQSCPVLKTAPEPLHGGRASEIKNIIEKSLDCKVFGNNQNLVLDISWLSKIAGKVVV